MPKHRRSRGWFYRGEHFDKPLTVAELVEECTPRTPKTSLWSTEWIHLGTVEQPLRVYIPNCSDDVTVGTITLTLEPEYEEYRALL